MQISDFLGQYQAMLDSASSSQSVTRTEGSVENLTSTLTQLQAGMIFEGSIKSISGSKDHRNKAVCG